MTTPARQPSNTIAAAIHQIQSALIFSSSPIPSHLLAAAAPVLSRPDYGAVVIERSEIFDQCGNPTCSNSLLPPSDRRRGRFHISLTEHRVYDLEEKYKYCSEKCLIASKTFWSGLEERRALVVSPSKIQRILAVFEGKESEIGDDKNGDLGITKLSIKEKRDAGPGEVRFEEWLGDSNAVEGYVPLHHRNRVSIQHTSSTSDTKVDDADIISTLILGDKSEVVLAKTSSDSIKDVSEMISKQLENAILEEKAIPPKNRLTAKSAKPKPAQRTNMDKFSGVDFSIVMGNQDNVVQPLKPSISSEKLLDQLTNTQENGKHEFPYVTVLKSSMKSTKSVKEKSSVTWADETKENGKNDAVGAKESALGNSRSSNIAHEGVDELYQLASADTCASILRHVAGAGASDGSGFVDAVSEAGIWTIPPRQYDKGEKAIKAGTEEELLEVDQAVVKWPKKTVLLDTNMFDCGDSWDDAPPDGFNFTLSSFATIWMALFEWITCSSLAFIYGRDDSSQEEFLVVNEREYLRKIVLGDRKSSEIRKTMDACIGRIMPGLVLDLKIGIPVSTLENAVGSLLDTMSFVNALPSLGTKQWRVVILLFLEALSVHRLPSLEPVITGQNMLVNKLLTSAEISKEEYETMRDLIVPLGRITRL